MQYTFHCRGFYWDWWLDENNNLTKVKMGKDPNIN